MAGLVNQYIALGFAKTREEAFNKVADQFGLDYDMVKDRFYQALSDGAYQATYVETDIPVITPVICQL